MEKIAIIGISCLFPGAETPQQYWQNLLEEKDSRSTATAGQMGVDAETFFAPNKGTQDKYYCMRGGYIQNFHFDSNGYNLPADFIDSLDDLFKWPLYVSRQALQDSGYLGGRSALERCGVVLGNLSFPTQKSHYLFGPVYKQALEAPMRELLRNQNLSLAQRPVGGPVSAENLMISGYPAAFVSQALGLGGVNFALDAACATSLYAVALASKYLLAGKADLMLAGAVSRADPFFINMGFSIFQAYPEDGISHPLNKHSGGLIAGEGAGMFALKRHSDALRDGDKIYAVIGGVGLSNDGKGKFLLQPNPKGQILAFERAYARANIDPTGIEYVECHATGTPIGDKTELNSMDAFFGRYGAAPLIGSAKSNLGHLLTAAGMAGMTKVILSMAHGQIPATINLSNPLSSKNNVISAGQAVKSLTPWPARAEIKRAAVSAFGFGGANAHLILESSGERPLPPTGGEVKALPLTPSQREGEVNQPSSPWRELEGGFKMAIIGMDAFFGDLNGLDDFGRAIYDGNRRFAPLPAGRWQGIEERQDLLKAYGLENGEAPQGAYITDFEMDFLHFKIPPNNDRPIPQQLLILKVADRALQDAGLAEGGNVAVIIASGTELSLHRFRSRVDLGWQLKESLNASGVILSAEQEAELEQISKNSIHQPAQVNQYTSFIGNIMASRISAQWDFSGPSFTLSAEENSTFKALELAGMFLSAGDVDAVLVGAVDLAGGAENVLLRSRAHRVNTGAQTLSIDQNASGWMVGEGAGAVVLKRYEDAVQAADRVYAVIDAVSVAQGASPTPSATNVVQVCRQAFAEAGLIPSDIGYLELFGSGLPGEDEAEIAGLIEAYKTPAAEPSCAIGSVKANIGHTYTASGMASLIKTAHALYHRYVPAAPAWSGPKSPDTWQGSPFYVAPKSKPWFVETTAESQQASMQVSGWAEPVLSLPKDEQTPQKIHPSSFILHPSKLHPSKNRVAAINGLGADGSYSHVILSDAPNQTLDDNTYLAQSPFLLFPLAGDSQEALLETLQKLRWQIEDAPSAAAVAHDVYEAWQAQPDATYAVSIVGQNKAKILREIERATAGVSKAFETGQPWKTPLGSYFTPNPLGKTGKVAFVYPGAFSSYPGLGRDIFQLFPQLHHTFANQVSDAGELLGEKALYPRSLYRLSKAERNALAGDLMADSITMLQSGAAYSTLVTTILRRHFKVQPQAALGYSLGETTMMFALGVWSPADNKGADLRNSPLFKDRLSGPQNAVRDYWNLSPAQNSTPIWAVYVLKASPANVSRAMETESRIYLTHTNTPQEVVIAGDPAACERVIQSLNCAHAQAPYNHVIHCEPMRSEQAEFAKLNTLPISDAPALDFYFAAAGKETALTSEAISRNIASAACQPVNFPQLVQQAYNDGARLFIELGPLSTCTGWINDILKGQDFMAAAINRKSLNDQTALVRLLAQLTGHRVSLDLSPLYPPKAEPAQKKRSLIRTVSLTGPRISDAILSEENRQKFADLPVVEAQPIKTVTAPQISAQPVILPKVKINQMNKDNLKEEVQTATQTSKVLKTFEVSTASTTFFDRQMQQLSENTSRANEIHSAFLQGRQEGLQQLSELIQMQLDSPPTPPEGGDIIPPFGGLGGQQPRPNNYSQPENIIWDEADLIAYAEGDIAPIFGEEYAVIDTYRRRVRLPMPPYLLVSRITKLNGKRGVYEPSTMTTEYDIPFEAWYATDGQIPWAVSVESGQCDLMLISYLGIDFANKGERVYRLLDCTLTFLDDMPLEGRTLRYDISIDSFAKSGDSLLFFFSYNCFVGDKIVLKMRGGCAGFFTDEELAGGKGIIVSEREKLEKSKIQKQHFKPLLKCSKISFTRADLLKLGRGEIAAVFGEQYKQQGLNPSLRLPPENILMVDRIVSVDPSGGAWGLGLIVSEKDLEPDHWYFPCHFKGDEVMAGSLVAEGCSQLLQFYLLYLGFQVETEDARFQPVRDLPQVVRTRKQIMACSSKLIYRMEITEIGLSPHPYAKANVDIIFEDRVVVDFKNLGLQLTEKEADDPYKVINQPTNQPINQPALFNDDHIQNFAMGSISACFGPDYEIFEGRRIPRTPNGDLKLISRITEINGERLTFSDNPGLVSEYDVPADPWFCRTNAYPTMPYSILMEIGLQPCGFLSAWLGSTLPHPDEDFYFRNLDGDGHLLQNIDTRGKTIINRVTLLSSTAIQGIIIQKFTYQLEVDSDVFFKGMAVFGYFQPQSLANQVGLDKGKYIAPWFEQNGNLTSLATRIDLNSPAAKERFFQSPSHQPHYRLADEQLNFLDEALVIPGGGTYQQGYVYAAKKINPQDWFYTCHFYQDPVMPGSLGVEAILQAMQIYALQQNLGADFKSPYFAQASGHKVVWTYRGQITPDNDRMFLEVHISKATAGPNQITITGDASLWKDEMRIYEVKDIALSILNERF